MSVHCARCDTRQPNGVAWPTEGSALTGARFTVCPDCAGTTGNRATAAGDAEPTDNQLKLFFDRLERLHEEKRGIADDIRDTFAEMKAQGYDVKISREILKLLSMQPHDRAERDALLDTYRAALGLG